MDDLEQRARELLAAEYERDGRNFTARRIREARPPAGGGEFQRTIRAIVAALGSQPQVQATVLAKDHDGMRVSYSGLLRQVRGALTRAEAAPDLAEMLRQLEKHMEELGKRWYSGDALVVDELLQLYCIEPVARAALKAAAPAPAPEVGSHG